MASCCLCWSMSLVFVLCCRCRFPASIALERRFFWIHCIVPSFVRFFRVAVHVLLARARAMRRTERPQSLLVVLCGHGTSMPYAVGSWMYHCGGLLASCTMWWFCLISSNRVRFRVNHVRINEPHVGYRRTARAWPSPRNRVPR